MKVRFRAALSHGLMAFLTSLGMVLTLLGVTGLLQHGWFAVGLLLALSGGCAAAALNRRIALGAGCVLAFAGCVWLLIGGAGMLAEVFRALLLHLSGLTTALPMVGTAFTALVCILSMAAGWFVTQRSAGAYPALILLVLIAVLLWLGDMGEVLPCMIPTAVACVTLLLRAGDEQTSTLRVLPLAVIVTGIAVAGAGQGAVSQPMKQLAEDIRQRIYDIFFYTQPRDVFTLATEGWYPQGMSQLGGPADPHDQPVMAVITPRKAYLRGVIKNIYTGRTWLDDIGGRRYLWSSPRFDELRQAAFDQELPVLDGTADASLLTTRILQVRMLRDSASTLFVPQRLRQLAPEGKLTPYFNGSSEVFATANLQAGDVWNVEAALFTSQDSGLAALVNGAELAGDEGYKTACDRYMQLHEQIDQRVYDLTAEITAHAATPFAKAMAIQQYLAAHYAYSLDVPEQSPQHDFVSTFLIETKEGYCTYFATAMTVMCRMAGLPARYVEGYVAYPDADGLAVVTGQEGHAWTEVYFSGFGWVTFDATPASADYIAAPPEEDDPAEDEADQPEQTPEPTSTPEPSVPPEELPTPTPAPQNAEPEPSPSAAPEENQSPVEENLPEEAAPARGWWVLLLALLALAVRWILVQPDVQARRKKTEFQRWLVYIQAVHDALRRHDLVRGRSESPAAFFARAAKTGRVRISLQELAGAENLMFYGHAAPYAEETAQARAAFRAVYQSLNAWQRLLFHLQRMCLPASRLDMTRR